MKVLFVGEGTHDIGPPGDEGAVRRGVHAAERRPARGVVPALFSGDRRPGLDRKVKGAALVAKRRFSLDALVCVHDRDGERHAYRLDDMGRGAAEVTALPVACGLAVESIEAWTLGACEALAAELGVDAAKLRRHYDPAQVEAFLPNSGKAEKQPKAILERMAAEAHREPDLALREAVADRTDVEALAKRCPEGFGKFQGELKKKLASSGT